MIDPKELRPDDLLPFMGIAFERLNCQRLVAVVVRELFARADVADLLDHVAALPEFNDHASTQLRADRFAAVFKRVDRAENGDIVLLAGGAGFHMALYVVDRHGRAFYFHTDRGHGSHLVPVSRAVFYTPLEVYSWN